MSKEENRILQEISMCRDDERNSHSLMIQVVGVAGAILGVLLGTSFFKGKEVSLLSILSDLVFLTAYFFITHLGIESVLRFHYIRDLEKKLRESDNSLYSFVDWMSAASPITTRNIKHLKHLASWTHYVAFMGTPIIALFLCLLIAVYLFWQVRTMYLVKLIFYIMLVATILGVLTLLLFCVNAQKIYEWSKEQAIVKLEAEKENQNKAANSSLKEATKKGEKKSELYRGILYYIYPKMQDMQKLFLIVLGALCAQFYQAADWQSLWNNVCAHWMDFWLVFFAVEYCLYAARYQWNDIRGVSEDEKANEKRREKGMANRGLPRMFGSKKKDVSFSSFIIGLRLVMCFATLSYLIRCKNKSYRSLVIVSILIILATILYEYFRERKLSKRIIFFVGFGYTLRFWAGFLVIQPCITDSLKEMKFILLALFFYGIMAATLPWTYFAKSESDNNMEHSKNYYNNLDKHIKALHNNKHTIRELIRAPWATSFLLSFCLSLINIAVVVNTSRSSFIIIFSVVVAAFVLGTFLFLYYLFDPNFSMYDYLKKVTRKLKEFLFILYLGEQTRDWLKSKE